MKFYINKLCIEIQYSFLLIIAASMLLKSYDYLYVLVFSVLHELGHIITLYLCGGKAEKIVFSYYGIGLKHNSKLTIIKEILFLISGVFVNLFFVLLGIQQQVNLALLVINTLPIYPLDGGRILKLVFNNLFSLEISDYFYKIISAIIICMLVVLTFYLKSISLLLIVVYVIFYSINNSID